MCHLEIGQYLAYLKVTACRPVNQHGERVTPSDFEAYCLSHQILGPCCLCPFQDRDLCNYKESPVYMVGYGRYAGEYVAACADGSCKYFGKSQLDAPPQQSDHKSSLHGAHPRKKGDCNWPLSALG